MILRTSNANFSWEALRPRVLAPCALRRRAMKLLKNIGSRKNIPGYEQPDGNGY
jgi:hypothetical protein